MNPTTITDMGSGTTVETWNLPSGTYTAVTDEHGHTVWISPTHTHSFGNWPTELPQAEIHLVMEPQP